VSRLKARLVVWAARPKAPLTVTHIEPHGGPTWTWVLR
jgi:hypothetical protein